MGTVSATETTGPRARPGDWPLVGRDLELARLTAMLVDAQRTGRPGVAVVEGELGVGKTRLLLDEVGARARAHGMVVLRGFEPGRPLAGLAESGGAAVILDDPRRADLDLVGSLLSAVPVVVLLGCRLGQLPAQMRAAIERASGGALWLRLGPLSVGDTDSLLDGEPAPRRLALHLASGGNPRYLSILACSPPEPLADLSAVPARLDGRVADALDRAITDELRGLDGPRRSVLHAASMLGEHVDLDLVAELALLDKEIVAGVVDELVGMGLLADGDGRSRFVHPLVRIAAYRLASPGARVLAHRRAAACLHRRGAGATQQAPHLELAAELGDSVAAEVLAATAETVLASAPATSVDWLRAALRVLPQGPDSAQVRSRLRVLLAKALVASGDLDAGRDELGDLRGLTAQARPAAVRLLAVIARLLGDLPAARRLASTELRRTGERPELHFELVTAELLAGRWSNAVKSAGALETFSARRHPGLPAAAASLRTPSAVPGSRLTELVDLLRQATELVDGLDDGALCDVLDVTVTLGWVQLLVDNVAEALRHIDRGLALAQLHGQRHVMAQLYPIRSIAHGRGGSIAESLRAADDAVTVAQSVGSNEMTTFARIMRLRPLWLRVGPLAASRAAVEVDAAPRLGSTWHRLPRMVQQTGQRGLTTREREIAELVAQGMTNRTIADALYLSPRTVDAHVRRILTKLGVTSRAAIARHLTER